MEEITGKIELSSLLRFAISQQVSDVHLKPGRPPVFRKGGNLVFQKNAQPVAEEDIHQISEKVMHDYHREILKKNNEVDLAYSLSGVGRFRINIFKQRGTFCCVMRVIPAKIPSLKELNLPPILEKICLSQRGLILITGAAGQGKSTTLASMLDYINKTRSCHIISIEDPVEYVIEDKRSIINQREVGVDTPNFHTGLRSALRQDPDIIVVGEMRDRETISTAILGAETGHLVFSTLHTVDAKETINRVIVTFSEEEQSQIRFQLASILQGVISLRLIQTIDWKSLVPAVEVLISTPRIQDLIKSGFQAGEITNAIAQGYTNYGMQTFDQSVMSLFQRKMISYDEAIKHCSNPSDFILKLKGIESSTDIKWDEFVLDKKK